MAVLGRAVGLRGEIEIRVLSDDPARFDPGAQVLVAGALRPLTVAAFRTHGDRRIVRFTEVADRESAEALRGTELVIPVEAARSLGPQEFWDHDLIGCRVFTREGKEAGTVDDVLHSAANDVLDVGGRLVPLVGAIVVEVDPVAKRIVIQDMPGLLADDG